MHPPQKRGKPADLAYLKPKARGPTHHFTDSVEPQTPLGAQTPIRPGFPPMAPRKPPISPLLRWAVEPAEALPILLTPLILFLNWELLLPHILAALHIPHPLRENPFAPCFLLAHRVPALGPARYGVGPGDVAFVAYHVVAFSLVRQVIAARAASRVGRLFGLTRTAKLERFGEQGYAFVYFLVFGAWGMRVMHQLPTWWYRTDYFWIDYPHTAMPPELKRYYLLQTAYWVQQFLVLVLGLEKPRKDYTELVAHHVVTLFLVIVSYVMNLTYIGSAVYMSMDIPDMFLALSKLLNYIQYNTLNYFVFTAFVGSWTYFRHYLNLTILWSVWFDLDERLPSTTRIPPSVRYGAFGALVALQALNLFWYYLILRIVWKIMTTAKAADVRSDDEDGDEAAEEDDAPPRTTTAPSTTSTTNSNPTHANGNAREELREKGGGEDER
ncbi:longevity assurance proteins LAG1/LAC1 [Mycena filopes]|nr:longevity assurance proteins LAG1/LAC1 [Mycena filopes]